MAHAMPRAAVLMTLGALLAAPGIPGVAEARAQAASAAPSRPDDGPRAPWHDDPAVPPQQDAKALEILNKGIEALGGADAILGRHTIYLKKKVVNYEYPESREGTIIVWFKRPDRLRKEVTYPDRRHVEAFDRGMAWFDSGEGPKVRGPVVTAAILDGLEDLDMPANYLDADLTYFNVSQEIPGKLAHVVKVRKNGYTRELMFDVDTMLLEVSGEYENPWGATDKMTKFDRYRPVDGVLVPYHVEFWRASRMISETEILEISFDKPLDDSLFAFPSGSSKPASRP